MGNLHMTAANTGMGDNVKSMYRDFYIAYMHSEGEQKDQYKRLLSELREVFEIPQSITTQWEEKCEADFKLWLEALQERSFR